MIHRVVYMSTLRDLGEDRDQVNLEARLNAMNAEYGVTSVAMRTDDTVLHAIEGEADRVRRAFAMAQTDPRHHDFFMLENAIEPAVIFGAAAERPVHRH